MKFFNFYPEEGVFEIWSGIWGFFVVGFDLVLGISQGCQVSINDQGGLLNPIKTKNEIFQFFPRGRGI